MVATYNSTQYAANAPMQMHGDSGKMQTAYASIAVTTALGLNDVLNMFYLPKGARVHNAILKSTDIDTGSAAITLDVGDAGSATRYFSASTAGQAGTVDASMAATGRFFLNTAKTLVIITIHAAAATPAAGTIELAIHFVCEDSATS